MQTQTVDAQTFRNALSCFCSGVTIISADDGESFHGMTATAFSSVSLSPPLILVCLGNTARMNSVLTANPLFGVSILHQGQEAISTHFSGRAAMTPPMTRLNGVPVIKDALAHLACHTVSTHVAGDHTIHIGEVVGCATTSGTPLLHYAGRYRELKS